MIFKNFEITRKIYLSSEKSEQFLKLNGFSLIPGGFSDLTNDNLNQKKQLGLTNVHEKIKNA